MISLLIQAGVALAVIGAEYAYHRWFEHGPVDRSSPQGIQTPRVDEGAPYPMIYGRVRVRAPILVWNGASTFDYLEDSKWRLNMILVIGITMADGNGTTRLHRFWAGDLARTLLLNADNSEDPGPEELCHVETPGSELIGPFCTYYDGNPAQDPGAGELGQMQTDEGVDILHIPARVGRLTVCLGKAGGGLTRHWSVGESPSVPAYSFEASSYYTGSSYPAAGSDATIGLDCNPVNILWDLFVAKLGKLGIPEIYLDKPSFQSAGTTLKSESFGLSFSFEEAKSADQLIQEVLRHVDGAIDEDPSTGRLVLTLVRPVDPSTLLHVTKDNCDKLTNFVAAGWTGLQSSLRLHFTDRDRDYNDNTVIIPTTGNAVNQSETEELEVEMRGITELALATRVADREAQARLRPIMKCSVYVGREFAGLVRGNAVKLTWSGPDISDVVFRVVDVDRGTIEDGKIRLDLIQDYFYAARGESQEPLLDRANLHGDISDFMDLSLG